MKYVIYTFVIIASNIMPRLMEVTAEQVILWFVLFTVLNMESELERRKG